jgi:hypothetical protein
MATVLKPLDEHLPRFPTSDEIRETRNAGVRLGSPDDTDDVAYYIHRYNRILAGISPALLTVKDFTFACDFEWTLADLKACERCDGECRSFRGHNRYMDFDRRAYDIAVQHYEKDGGKLPKPRFAMQVCLGATERMRQLAALYKQVTRV